MCTYNIEIARDKIYHFLAITMKSTKVQTLGGIWRKYWIIWIENTLHAYVLGEHTSMKNEL